MNNKQLGPAIVSDLDREIALLENNFGFRRLCSKVEDKINECMQTAVSEAAGGKDGRAPLLTAHGMKRALDIMQGCIKEADGNYQKERMTNG